MTVTEERPSARPPYFRDELVRPFVVVAAIVGTIVQWPSSRILLPPVALTLFILVAIAAVGALLPWTRLTARWQIAAMAAYIVFGSLLQPFAHGTTTAALFPYLAASTAGAKLDSRRGALGVGLAGSLTATGAVLAADLFATHTPQWPWWVPLTVGLPVFLGISQRDRLDALYSAQRAAREARRATESETREAALLERGRIAREIHDVLGHSLSGIALQLDMADALHESGRDEEVATIVRKARALAVDSISETRRAVHALREDTLPLTDTLRVLAEHNAAGFETVGEAGTVGAEATHTLVRAAQEALTNAAKYAPGARCHVRLACTADRVTLTVRNEPPTEALRSDLAGGSGVGLVGMRERAALLGGTLQAGPAREGGWTVELELPR
ncbi:sensor histidine kinase [Streptomyces sp. 8L]|uniref:sensor histidine kinase n=1 Tax=Streptomyces sp. 8L TaxID=2877242 RepID=UPI001CD5A94D|nr:histidine kinase [Streptomyces sp. 8L]MCA1223311.1 histidine kinase [Streptomyces sp. 8L]